MKSAKQKADANLEYKGYTGSVHISHRDRVFWGKIEGIRATVTYEGSDFDSLEAAFKESVDEYLDLCKEQDKEPEKPFKGVFQVRVPQELHRELIFFAAKKDMTLNGVAKLAFEHLLKCKSMA